MEIDWKTRSAPASVSKQRGLGDVSPRELRHSGWTCWKGVRFSESFNLRDSEGFFKALANRLEGERMMRNLKNFVSSSWGMIRSNLPKGVFQRTGIPLLAMFSVGIMSLPVEAQITSGTILGTITDPSGAAIPGA